MFFLVTTSGLFVSGSGSSLATNITLSASSIYELCLIILLIAWGIGVPLSIWINLLVVSGVDLTLVPSVTSFELSALLIGCFFLSGSALLIRLAFCIRLVSPINLTLYTFGISTAPCVFNVCWFSFNVFSKLVIPSPSPSNASLTVLATTGTLLSAVPLAIPNATLVDITDAVTLYVVAPPLILNFIEVIRIS